MILRLSLDLPEDAAYLSITRHLSRSLLEHLRVIEEDIGDVEFVVNELATNVLRHAPDHGYRVEVEYHADQAVITVVDSGPGFSFADVLPPGTPRPEIGGGQRLGGWGLPLVQMFADRVQFFRTDPHGTTVRAEKALHYLDRAAANTAARLEDHEAVRVQRLTAE